MAQISQGFNDTGFDITGDLQILNGNGTIHMLGTLFTDTINSYSSSSASLYIKNVEFNTTGIYLQSTNGNSLVSEGGIDILKHSLIHSLTITDTSNSSFNVLGDATFNRDLTLGTQGTLIINNTSSSLFNYGITVSVNTTDAFSYSSGSVIISGGASVRKNLYARYLFSDYTSIANLYAANTTLPNAVINILDNNTLYSTNANFLNSTVNNLTINSGTASNIYLNNVTSANSTLTNVTANSIFADSITVTNLAVVNSISYNELINSISTSNLHAINASIASTVIVNATISNAFLPNSIITGTSNNLFITNSTITNTFINNASASNFATDSIITNNLFANFSTIANEQVTNASISSANIFNGTISNALLTNASVSNSITTNASVSNASILNASIFNALLTNASTTNLITTNASASNSIIVNATTTNAVITNGLLTNASISTGILTNTTISSSYLQNTFIQNASASNVNTLFLESNTIITSNVSASNSSIDSLNLLTGTFGNIRVANATVNNIVATTSVITLGTVATLISSDSTISNLYANTITGLNNPSNSSDAVNLSYLNGLFSNYTAGQVIVGSTNGTIIGYPSFVYNNLTSNLILLGTANSASVTHGGTLTVLGGASIAKNLYIGGNAFVIGTLDMNNQVISSVATPITAYEAANKYYVDDSILISLNSVYPRIPVSNTNGTYTTYPELTFDSGSLVVNSTNSSVYGSTGSLFVQGTASFASNVFLNNGTITGVTSPSSNLDVANKYYVDTAITNYTIGNISGDITKGQVIIGSTGGNITGFSNFTFDTGTLNINTTNTSVVFDSTGSLFVQGTASFASKVFLNNGTITGVTSPNSNLDVANKYYVDSSLSNYTIGNISGAVTQGQVIVGGTGGSLTSYSTFTFDNNVLVLHSTENSTNSSTGSVIIKGGLAVNKDVYTEKVTGLVMPVLPVDAASKQYVDSFIGLYAGDIFERTFILTSNTIIPTAITGFIFDSAVVSSFDGSAVLTNGTKYTKWNIRGLFKGTGWILNSSFIGDAPIVQFSINSSGQVLYTCGASANTLTLRFSAKTTTQGGFFNITSGNFINFPVTAGGTGQTFFTSGAVLLGNGVGPIATSNKLLFNNSTGTLSLVNGVITGVTGPSTNLDVANKWYVDNAVLNGVDPITLFNTTNAFAPATEGGALSVYGGVSIAKNLVVQGIDILSQITIEKLFNASQSITVPTDITGFLIQNVRMFKAIVSVTLITVVQRVSGFDLTGVFINGAWRLNSTFVGDNFGIRFFITSGGQVQYTLSGTFAGFTSCLIKYRVTSLTV